MEVTKMNNKKYKALAYCRFSSTNQRESSIESQMLAIKRYAAEHDIAVEKFFADRAMSGKSEKRRVEFQKLLAECESGDYDFVIVHKFDRLGRNLSNMLKNMSRFEELGVELISVTQPDMGGTSGKLFRLIQWCLDEFYSDNLKDEVLKTLIPLAQKCQHTGGKPPLGLDVDPVTKRLVINESEAEAVRTIYKMYLDGYGYDKIAAYLNGKGYKTKEGKPFTHNSFYDLLRNKKYCGYFVFNRESGEKRNGTRNSHKEKDPDKIICIPNGVPAIISKETYNKAMEKMNANKRKQGAYKAKRNYLLSGLIRCGICGCAMQGSARKGGKSGNITYSYRCKHNKTICRNKEIGQAAIENYVLTMLEQYIFDDRNIPVILKGVTDAFTQKNYHNIEEVKRLDNVIRGYNRKLTNIKNAVMNGLFEKDFADDIAKIKSDIARLEEEKCKYPPTDKPPEITEEMLRGIIDTFAERVRARNKEDCKSFIKDFVDSVIVYEDKVEVNLKISPVFGSYPITKTLNRKFLPAVIPA